MFYRETTGVTSDQRETRRVYAHGELRRVNLQMDPMAQFANWLEAATEASLVDATAMTLATVDPRGRPSARIVLLKQFNRSGYVWYTAYDSKKGADLVANPQATLLFYWREFERQVRISGAVERITRAESETYFATRPLDSRFAAAASHQSAHVDSRDVLEARVADLQERYPTGDMPVPRQWGGYRLTADEYEFWQGREGRLHDRFYYQHGEEGWDIERLQP